jgi:ATP-dependent Clp protease ATP-binding subunit ClpB
LNQIAKRLNAQEIVLNTTDKAISQLALLGFDPQYGGRPVKRTLQQQVLNPLSKALLEGTISKEEEITLDYFETEFIFGNRNEASN